MAIKQIKPGKSTVTAEAKARPRALPGPLVNPPGGLYPMRSAAFEVDQYRILEGWPVPIPACDIRVETLVSGDGVFLADREKPTSITTGAHFRWLADDSYFNQTTGSWVPIQGSDPSWISDPDHLPSLINDYEYTVDDERFVGMSALNFDSDTADYLTTDFSRAMSTKSGYTVLMVMSPNSAYGNNEDVPFNALWCSPEDPTLISVNIRIRDLFLEVDFSDKPLQVGIAMARAARIQAPSYLTMVINRPTMTMYLGQGPQNMIVKRLDIGPASANLNGNVLLGKWPGDMAHNADMALFDLGLYGDTLSSTQVQHEVSLLSKVYGGT